MYMYMIYSLTVDPESTQCSKYNSIIKVAEV